MDRRIVLTGAGRGLGYCVAEKHLRLNDRVFALEKNITDELQKLQEKNPQALDIIACDVGDTQSVERAGKRIQELLERVDILYNIAGIYRFEDRTGLAMTDMDAFTSMYNVNAVGPLRVCKAIFHLLQPGSVVVNISSEAGSIGDCWRREEYAYCMSKAALNMGARILANELTSRKVRVMNLHPGWLRTQMGGDEAFQSRESVSPQESAEAITDIAMNIGRYPQEIRYMEYTGNPLPW